MISNQRDQSTDGAKRERYIRYAIYGLLFLAWAVLIFYFTRGLQDRDWLANWSRWDARWYEQIWMHGYPGSDPRTLAFPPGYSLVVGVLAKLFSRSFLGTGIILNLIAFFATATMLAEWFAWKFAISPYLVFGFILSAPVSYFALTSYSDILFMLLLWVLLRLSLPRNQPRGHKSLVLQCAILFVLPWMRLTGYALISWLLDRKVAALAVLGSFALWLGLNRRITGDPFYFLRAQSLFEMPSGNFFQGLAFSCERLVSSDVRYGFVTPWLQFAFLPLFYLGALTTAAIWMAKRGEHLLAITVLSILILSHNQSVWRSVVRYDLPLFPVLCVPLLVTAESRRTSYVLRTMFYVLLAGQFVLQFYFARLFHSGGWAF